MLFISFDLLAFAAMQSVSALISDTHLASSNAARCSGVRQRRQLRAARTRGDACAP